MSRGGEDRVEGVTAIDPSVLVVGDARRPSTLTVEFTCEHGGRARRVGPVMVFEPVVPGLAYQAFVSIPSRNDPGRHTGTVRPGDERVRDTAARARVEIICRRQHPGGRPVDASVRGDRLRTVLELLADNGARGRHVVLPLPLLRLLLSEQGPSS